MVTINQVSKNFIEKKTNYSGTPLLKNSPI